MKTKHLMTLLVLALFLFSCDSESRNEEQMNLDVDVEFSIADTNGNDLLNPENENSYNHEAIKLFYKTDGVYQEFYDGNLDLPRNINIYQHTDTYRATIFLNHSASEEQPETLIQWNENNADTIKCEIYRTSSVERIDKVWLNNQLVWDSTNNTAPYFELTK